VGIAFNSKDFILIMVKWLCSEYSKVLVAVDQFNLTCLKFNIRWNCLNWLEQELQAIDLKQRFPHTSYFRRMSLIFATADTSCPTTRHPTAGTVGNCRNSWIPQVRVKPIISSELILNPVALGKGFNFNWNIMMSVPGTGADDKYVTALQCYRSWRTFAGVR